MADCLVVGASCVVISVATDIVPGSDKATANGSSLVTMLGSSGFIPFLISCTATSKASAIFVPVNYVMESMLNNQSASDVVLPLIN